MRKEIILQDGWIFKKNVEDIKQLDLADGKRVSLPHTYNAIDGQDGGNDYFRGTCWYQRNLNEIKLLDDEKAYLEFDGAAITTNVYLNGKHLAKHEGGFSRFRVDITNSLQSENNLLVSVNNSVNDNVYPQAADFTFYGGLYRDVKVIIVPNNHFELNYYGGDGIKVTPEIKGQDALVKIEAWIHGDAKYAKISTNGETKKVLVEDFYVVAEFEIENVRLWDGLNDPYLYTAVAVLDSGDKVKSKYGCRYFEVDPQKGFLLNGRQYPLRGVSRHQDRAVVGNALTKAMHVEDMEFIEEIGANSIRLAHYQHAQEFYDLCDEKGIIVWAEIPYITKHMPNGRDNTLSQMQELVIQNYNHPSIVVWGLSNEITAASSVDDNLIENHEALHNLCKRLDQTRLTTIANVFMLETDSPILDIADINSYNLYFGWYLGELSENDQFFDDFHQKYPKKPIGFSEYGADANPQFQNSNPTSGDYSETYQAVYHEHMLKMISERPWLWSTYVWNMFDFAADGRDEGGKHGENQKGLVTIDRKIKKDAFYLYKAYWNTREKFVHLCGKRYIERAEDQTEIKVYSNLETVSLYVDDKHYKTIDGKYVFKFTIDITKEHTIVVKSGNYIDKMKIKKVDSPNKSYIFNNQGSVMNWFDKELVDPKYYSINDTLGEISENKQANMIVQGLMDHASASRGDVAQHVKDNPSLHKMMASMTLSSVLKQAGEAVSSDQIKELNNMLQKIEK